MKLYNYISALLIAGIASFSSCSQEDDLNEVNSSNGFQITVSDGGFLDTTPGTRAVENEYTTEFVDGDAIGVFAVDEKKNIVSDINNRKFTMNNGTWTLEGPIIEYKGAEFGTMTFYAYYPYNENVKFDTSKKDPFEDYVKEWKIEENQSGEEYTKYDLMTSSSAVVADNHFKGEIKFTMQHCMALVVLKMPKLVYNFINPEVTLDDYELPVTNVSFKLDDAGVTPYYQESTDTYRFLVKPGQEFILEGTYTGIKEMTCTATATLNGGTAKVYTVTDANKKEYTLAVGDYYCADGSIVSKDVADKDIPDNVIGIVCYVGNPQPSITHEQNGNTETNDALRRDYPNCKHGLVLALNNTLENTNKFSSWRNTNEAYCDWFGNDEEFTGKFVACNTGVNAITKDKWAEQFPAFMGYNNTMLLTMCYEGKGQPTMCDDAYGQITAYRDNVAVPVNATPWYLPSIACLEQVAKSLSAVNGSLGKVSTATPMESVAAGESFGFYWSSTLRNGYTQWVHAMNGGSYNKVNSYGSTAAGYFRMMLAF